MQAAPHRSSANGHETIAIAPVTVIEKPKRSRFSRKRVSELLEQLAVPFDPLVIQWKIVETRRVSGRWQGRVLPYAGKLAYVQRLTELFTPIGWTSNVSVHSTVIGAGERGRSPAAKIVVTCHLTIHCIGSHSSTGEEWGADENAATSAEAQAFKRASANFGLGLYLYSFFRGKWVFLSNPKTLVNPPTLPDWATPSGWLAGARPRIEPTEDSAAILATDVNPHLIAEIEGWQNTFGAAVYRRILGRHRIWDPKTISEPEIAASVLADLKLAAPLMVRAKAAIERVGERALCEIMNSLRLKSIADFGNFGVLEHLVPELEARVRSLDAAG